MVMDVCVTRSCFNSCPSDMHDLSFGDERRRLLWFLIAQLLWKGAKKSVKTSLFTRVEPGLHAHGGTFSIQGNNYLSMHELWQKR